MTKPVNMARSLAEIMTNAFATRAPITLTLASPQERIGAKPNQCHENAHQYTKRYGGDVVGG